MSQQEKLAISTTEIVPIALNNGYLDTFSSVGTYLPSGGTRRDLRQASLAANKQIPVCLQQGVLFSWNC